MAGPIGGTRPALGSPELTGERNRLPQSVVGRFTKRRSAGE